MIKISWRRNTLVGWAAFMIIASGAGAYGLSAESHCEERLAKHQQTVHTTRDWTAEELPGVGDYEQIRWQTRALGNPCRWTLGPTDWRYQGLVQLRPDDAEALAKAYDWLPVTAATETDLETPAAMWPDLAKSLPASPRWLHSESYDNANPHGTLWRALYFDKEHSLVFFLLYTH